MKYLKVQKGWGWAYVLPQSPDGASRLVPFGSYPRAQVPEPAAISPQKAEEIVKTLPEVEKILAQAARKGAEARVEFEYEEKGRYLLRLESYPKQKELPASALGWYGVDKTSGKARSIMPGEE